VEAYVAAADDRHAARAAALRMPALLASVGFRALAWCLGFAAQARADRRTLDPRIAESLERCRRPEHVEHCVDVVGAGVPA
jgi:hypothetical protein